MLLHLCSILALGGVQSLSIGYPYRTLLSSHDSIQVPEKVLNPQGFLIYLDNSGIERVVSYNYLEPVYAVRRINFLNNESPIIQKFIADDLSEINAAREAHFRAWSLQQYQALKREIDYLRAEGKEPSMAMALKFIPLEKIALTSDYSTIADLPEIKHIREEHLNIWKQILPTNDEKVKWETKSSVNNSKSSPKQTNEELKQLELQQNNSQKDNQDHIDMSKISNEVKNVKTEARFSTESDNKSEIVRLEHKIEISDPLNLQRQEEKLFPTTATLDTENSEKLPATGSPIEKLDEQTIKSIIADIKKENLRNNSESPEQISEANSIQEQPSPLADTSEVLKTNQNPSLLEMDSKKHIYRPEKVHSEVEKLISTAPTIYVPQQVVDTVEVMRARDEHLKIVREAIQKAKLAHQQGQQRDSATKLPDIVSNGTRTDVSE